MIAATFSRTSVVVLLASCLLLAQQPETPPSAPQEKPPAQEPATQSEPAETKPPEEQTKKLPGLPDHPKEFAWNLLEKASTSDKTSDRTTAISVLGLMPKNRRAQQMALKALSDEKPEVRSAAANALGEMQARSGIPKLHEALSDKEPSVVLAAAHALDLMHDTAAFEVYYEVLTGERKASKGLIASQTEVLHDPKKLATLGIEQGIGFIPFAGIPWEAFRAIKKSESSSSPVRAAAARALAEDTDPQSGRALADAANHDKNWIVRAAALGAIAKRGDSSLLQAAELDMSDDKEAVKYTAAAATLHLMDLQKAPPAKSGKKK
jgi:HEAT repeat protein